MNITSMIAMFIGSTAMVFAIKKVLTIILSKMFKDMPDSSLEFWAYTISSIFCTGLYFLTTSKLVIYYLLGAIVLFNIKSIFPEKDINNAN